MTGIYSPQTQIYKVVGTLAQVLAVTGSVGDEALVTNIGFGVTVRWAAGIGWRLSSDQRFYASQSLAYGVASTDDTVVKQAILPARWNEIASGLRIEAGWQKSGTATAASGCRIRIGATGTTADTSVTFSSALVASSRSISGSRTLAVDTSTTLILSGSQSSAVQDFAFVNVANAYPTTYTINNMSATDTYISVCMQMAAVGDQPGAYNLKVVGLS